MAAFRHLLHRCGVSPCGAGNVVALDPTSILAVGHVSAQRDAIGVENTNDAEYGRVLDDHDC